MREGERKEKLDDGQILTVFMCGDERVTRQLGMTGCDFTGIQIS